MRHGKHVTAQRIVLDQRPVIVQVLGASEIVIGEAAKGFLHRIERIGLARQDRALEQAVQVIGGVLREEGIIQ